jgi:glycosyltransferase involved in cell wall biosynthesis
MLFLQLTRVVPRKGIELSIELVRWLQSHPFTLHASRFTLVITHHAGDEGLDHLHQLQAQAAAAGVDLRYVADRVAPRRSMRPDGVKIYSLWDVYSHADFVTYPSLYEGFGNALIEAVYFRKPVLVNRYPVYVADIGPLGFDFVEIDGTITDEAVAEVQQMLADPERRWAAVEKNFRLGEQHFSYEVLKERLQELLASF